MIPLGPICKVCSVFEPHLNLVHAQSTKLTFVWHWNEMDMIWASWKCCFMNEMLANEYYCIHVMVQLEYSVQSRLLSDSGMIWTCYDTRSTQYKVDFCLTVEWYGHVMGQLTMLCYEWDACKWVLLSSCYGTTSMILSWKVLQEMISFFLFLFPYLLALSAFVYVPVVFRLPLNVLTTVSCPATLMLTPYMLA